MSVQVATKPKGSSAICSMLNEFKFARGKSLFHAKKKRMEKPCTTKHMHIESQEESISMGEQYSGGAWS